MLTIFRRSRAQDNTAEPGSPDPSPTSHIHIKKEPSSPPKKATKRRRKDVVEISDDPSVSDDRGEGTSKQSSARKVPVVEIRQSRNASAPSKKVRLASTPTDGPYDVLQKQFVIVSEAFKAISAAMEDLQSA